MATYVANCPRCSAQKMTFDILSDVHVGSDHGWAHYHEITALCRHCNRPSIMLIRLRDYNSSEIFGGNGRVTGQKSDVTPLFELKRQISIADLAAKPAPDFLPDDILQAFSEGTRCLAIGCNNAAGSMFRLCLDLATRSLLPAPDDTCGPTKHERRNLAPRLSWLFNNNRLPHDLKDLSSAVKENGDEGAHEGWLNEHDTVDLYEFAFELLERLFTYPAKIEQAKARRADRKAAAEERNSG